MAFASQGREARLPLNASELQLYKVLQRANLLCYFDIFVAQGGDDVSQMLLAEEDEFLEIMTLVGMASKPLHVRRLQRALQEWLLQPGLFKKPVVNSNPSVADELPKELVIAVMRNEVPLPASIANCPINLKDVNNGIAEIGKLRHSECPSAVREGCSGMANGAGQMPLNHILSSDNKKSSCDHSLTEPLTIEAKPPLSKKDGESRTSCDDYVKELCADIPSEKVEDLKRIVEELSLYVKENWKIKGDVAGKNGSVNFITPENCENDSPLSQSNLSNSIVFNNGGNKGLTYQQKVINAAAYLLCREIPSLQQSQDLLLPLGRQVYHIMQKPPAHNNNGSDVQQSRLTNWETTGTTDIYNKPPIRNAKRTYSYIKESLANEGLRLVLDETIASLLPKKIKIA